MAHKADWTEPDAKQCTKCHKIYPIDDFGKRRKARQKGYEWFTRGTVCKECRREYNRQYNATDHALKLERGRRSMTASRNKLRLEVFSHYGGRCLCCGEDFLPFLSIDHINGRGEHGRQYCGIKLYQWLRLNKFPPGYRVLCLNCNMAVRNFGQDINKLRAAIDAHRSKQ